MQFPKSREEYIYQLTHAADIADRITAARSLAVYREDPGVREALAAAASSDRFWGVRESALTALAETGSDSAAGIFLAAASDPKSTVRNTAASHLSGFKGKEAAVTLDALARTDSSYLVASTALRELASVDTVLGFDAARDLLPRESYREIVRLSALSALRVLHNPAGIGLALPYTDRKYGADVRRLALAVLGERGKDSASARERLKALLSDSDPSIRSGAVSAVMSWKDPEFDQILANMESGESSPEVLPLIKKALHPPPEHDSGEEK
jgi:HEAT repeat protein